MISDCKVIRDDEKIVFIIDINVVSDTRFLSFSVIFERALKMYEF